MQVYLQNEQVGLTNYDSSFFFCSLSYVSPFLKFHKLVITLTCLALQHLYTPLGKKKKSLLLFSQPSHSK